MTLRTRGAPVDGPSPRADDLADEPALAWRSGLPRSAADDGWARRRTTSVWRQWCSVVAATLASGPVAVVAALVENGRAAGGMLLLLVLFAPVIEETVKSAGAFVLAELRPWLVPAAWALPLITLCSGLTFAAIENWWYLTILIEEPSDELVAWRWTFGPLIHGTCSLIAGVGAARMWTHARRRGAQPAFDRARPLLIGAAALHGGYNLLAIVLEATGHIG